MKKIIVKSYEDMSELMVSILLGEMVKDKRTNISITGGSTPIRVFEILSEKFKLMKDVLNDTYFYNFDDAEIEGVSTTNTLLKKQFYDTAEVNSDNIVSLTVHNYLHYDEEIKKHGGLDLMMIGLGMDGHFCGNMPYAADFSKETYAINIEKKYPWYSNWEEMCKNCTIPEYFVTMGFKSLLKTKHLVMIVNGKKKAEAVKRMLTEDINNSFPSTILRMHPNFTLILDEEAASAL